MLRSMCADYKEKKIVGFFSFVCLLFSILTIGRKNEIDKIEQQFKSNVSIFRSLNNDEFLLLYIFF